MIEQMDQGTCGEKNADISLCLQGSMQNGCDGYAEIYAETDTSFEVSGVPLATAAKDTESLWGSVDAGAGA
jgi:hypothetical protein